MNLKNKLLFSIIHEFLEYCYSSAEWDLGASCFYGKESCLIEEFLEKREKEKDKYDNTAK